jgi:hypothetical protein
MELGPYSAIPSIAETSPSRYTFGVRGSVGAGEEPPTSAVGAAAVVVLRTGC